MGEPKPTVWQLIHNCQNNTPAALRDRKAFEDDYSNLVGTFVRGSRENGGSGVEALVSGFFPWFWKEELISEAQPVGGPFRLFLKDCVEKYLTRERHLLRIQHFESKEPTPGSLASDEAETDLPTSRTSPISNWDRYWSLDLLERVRCRLSASKDGPSWQLDQALINKYLFFPPDDGMIAALAREFAQPPAFVKEQLHRLRSAYQTAFREEIMGTLTTARSVGAEIQVVLKQLNTYHTEVAQSCPETEICDTGESRRCSWCDQSTIVLGDGQICRECLARAEVSWLEDEPEPSILGYSHLTALDKGGTAAVYCARNIRRELVALKVLKWEFRGEPEVREFFKHEPNILSRLDHPNIVRVLGQDTTPNGIPYFAMPMIEGGTLKQHMPRIRKNPEAALRLMVKVIRAIEHAHYQGVIHQDLKPENIVLDEADEPYLIDFGVSRDNLTEILPSGTGTPGYIAPELGHARFQSSGIRPAVDIFSLGVILCELMTALMPVERRIEGEDSASAKTAARFETVCPEGDLVSGALRAIINKCLRPVWKQRYRYAGDLARDLELYLSGSLLVAEQVKSSVKSSGWMGSVASALAVVEQFKILERLKNVLVFIGISNLFVIYFLVEKVTEDNTGNEQIRVQQSCLENAKLLQFEVNRQLKVYQSLIREEGRRKELVAAMTETSSERLSALQHFCQQLMYRYWSGTDRERLHEAQPFDSCFVHNSSGMSLARWPLPDGYGGKDFSFRDYAKRVIEKGNEHSREVVVSRAFLSQVDKNWKIGFAVPIYLNDVDETFAGYLVTTVRTDQFFGNLPPLGDGAVQIILGRRDDYGSVIRPTENAPSTDWVVLFHPALEPGHALKIDSLSKLNRFDAVPGGAAAARKGLHLFRSSNYRDPIAALPPPRANEGKNKDIFLGTCPDIGCVQQEYAAYTLAAAIEQDDWSVVVEMKGEVVKEAASAQNQQLLWWVAKAVAIAFLCIVVLQWGITTSIRWRRFRTLR